MPVRMPSAADLERIADHFHFQLSQEELEAYSRFIKEALPAYLLLDELEDGLQPVKYPRNDLGRRPLGADNPVNGWAWKCLIRGAEGGVLAGRSVALKDNINVAGIPTMNGSPVMEGYIPREDATVVTRLLDAGATVTGKAANSPHCFDGAAISLYPGPQPINPHHFDHCTGGSSAGSGALVANGEVDMAVGGDQGGSIRIPACWSGIVGLKPTWGLVPHTGAIAFDPVLDHLGPMTRTVEDCAKMLTAIAGPDGLDPRQGNCRAADYLTDLHSGVEGMRIGILAEGFDWPGVIDQNVADTVRAAAQSYRDLGAQVCEVSVPWHPKGLTLLWAIVTEATSNSITMETAGAGSRGHYPLDAVDFYSSARRARANEFPHTVKVSALLGQWASERYGRRYYTKAMNLLPVLKEAYDQALNSVDVLVMPTMLFRAPPKPKEQATVYERIQLMANMIQNTGPFNLSGHPALTIPCRVLEGLPVGMQIVGSHFDEAKLLRIARAYEAKGAAS